jgi:Leucine Rich repeat
MEQHEDIVGIEPRILLSIRISRQYQKGFLCIDHCNDVNRQNVQYFVDFLSGERQQGVIALDLTNFRLVEPPDGGLNVLCNFFANVTTTLTKVGLFSVAFGTAEEASRLFAALQTSRSVTDLAIYKADNLEGAALGNCICALLQNNPRLQRLSLLLRVDAVMAHSLQTGLRSNGTLKILDLSCCEIDNEVLGLLVDTLIGNTTMEELVFRFNDITTKGLVHHVTRLIELTRLQTIDFRHNRNVIVDNNIIQCFADVLRRHSTLEELCLRNGFSLDSLDRYPVITNMLARNVSIRRSKQLVALQSRTGLLISSKSGIWCKVMAKLSSPRPDCTSSFRGASAIFHILQTRPGLLEKQRKRPPATVAAAAAVHSMATTGTAKGGEGLKRRRI